MNFEDFIQKEKKALENLNEGREDTEKKLETSNSKSTSILKQNEKILKETNKNIRYAKYAMKHKLQIDDDDDLINECNIHRNTYIAKKAYDDGYVGYSKCYKDYRECDGNMKFGTDYTIAGCDCGLSTWYLLDPGSDFDISDTTAEGDHWGYSYFWADFILNDEESDEESESDD